MGREPLAAANVHGLMLSGASSRPTARAESMNSTARRKGNLGPLPLHPWSGIWLVALAGACVWAALHAWIGDDIYITFRYCDNVLAGHGPVYNPGERSEGYTHFLWFAMLTIGRALHVPAEALGKFLPLPFYAGCLALLVLLSHRLFAPRGGLLGVPLAALAWAAHEDARLYATGGLETSFYIFALLLGFTMLCASSHPRRHAIAGWAYATATLIRPDGMLFSGLAFIFVLWRGRSGSVHPWWRQSSMREFALVWAVLVLPLFAFRLLYYGYPFPNPYYAKSASAANWPQGWAYLWTYFGAYFVLIGALLAVWPLWRRFRRRDRSAKKAALRGGPAYGGEAHGVEAAMALALVTSSASILFVTRMGGDFMYARFYLPATPFLLLVIEWLVHLVPRRALRLAAALAVIGLVLFAAVRKQAWFSDKRHVRSIVDEPQYYPDLRLEDVRAQALALERCLASAPAVLMVQGGQASLAYYARFPVAIERYGLTDVHIAHGPVPPIRGRPGHEKLADAQYIFDRKVNFRFHGRPVRSVPQYAQMGIPWTNGMVFGEIILYDRELMERLKSCGGIRFLDFPLWLLHDYLPRIGTLLPARVAADYNQFLHFYFDHNPDPEGLRAQLDAALTQLGIEKITPEPLRPDYFEDTGRTSMPGGL